MEKNKKIGIIGHFGGNTKVFDGQTIKTKILYDELQKTGELEIITVDTYYKKHNPVKLMHDTLKCLKSAQDIIILLSRNGMRLYFPLLFFYVKHFHTRIYHDVIGGNLDKYVKQYSGFKKYLNSFVVNWVETNGLKKRLEMVGVDNCQVIPNFKRLPIVESMNMEFEEPYSFCTFSRVMKEKGIEAAIEAVEDINKKAGKILCTLDIYGQIDDGYTEHFKNLMSMTSNAVSYKGVVAYDQSVSIIKNYYALLFPTYWNGEGFPGTIVDAFSAGVPVIGTDWNCNGEIIEDGVNGILYPNDKIKDLEEAIEWLIENKNQMIGIKQNCVKASEKYQPDEYIEKIIRIIKHTR